MIAGATEFVGLPAEGRRFTDERRVRLGDVTASGRLRLDALARFLQDVAGDDVADAGIEKPWVMRRVAMRLGTLPRFRDTVELVTFCSGTGRRWAERRTDLHVDGRLAVETVSIWVYVDPDSGRPLTLEDWFFDLYRVAAGGRQVTARLQLPSAPDDAVARSWPLRVTDFDVLGHVNNAAYWEAVEEEVARSASGRRIEHAELEHRGAVEPGSTVELRTALNGADLSTWVMQDGEVRTAARVQLG